MLPPAETVRRMTRLPSVKSSALQWGSSFVPFLIRNTVLKAPFLRFASTPIQRFLFGLPWSLIGCYIACPGSVDPDRRIPAFPAFGDLVVGTIAVITDVIGVNGTGLHYRLSLAHSDLPSWGVCPKGQSQILASPKIKLGYLTLTASCCAHSESRT